jgi:hypothetical protein
VGYEKAKTKGGISPTFQRHKETLIETQPNTQHA